jgi:hypothetical protein
MRVAENREPPSLTWDGLIHDRMLFDLFQVDERTMAPVWLHIRLFRAYLRNPLRASPQILTQHALKVFL